MSVLQSVDEICCRAIGVSVLFLLFGYKGYLASACQGHGFGWWRGSVNGLGDDGKNGGKISFSFSEDPNFTRVNL
jgi:hypothetical protein